MDFLIGYSDGDEIVRAEHVTSACAALEADLKCQETTGGNISVVIISPVLQFQDGQWVVKHGEVEKVLKFDHRRSQPWSSESVYHAIEKAFE